MNLLGEPVRPNKAPPLSLPEGQVGATYRAGAPISCRDVARVSRVRKSKSALLRGGRQANLKTGAGQATAILYHILKRVSEFDGQIDIDGNRFLQFSKYGLTLTFFEDDWLCEKGTAFQGEYVGDWSSERQSMAGYNQMVYKYLVPLDSKCDET